MNNTNCKINAELGEKILFANGSAEKALAKEQEEHYLTCEHTTCKSNMKYLKEQGIFMMNEEEQAEYDEKQRLMEDEE